MIKKEFKPGFDVDARRVFLHGDIDSDFISQTIEQLFYLDAPNKTTSLIMNSFGGSINDMYAFYGAIQLLESEIHIISTGYTMSAAVLLLASGDKRSASPHCAFMIHESSVNINAEGNLSNVDQDIKFLSKLDNKWYELMEHHTGTSVRTWKKLCNKGNYYFDAEEALELGIIDEII